MNLNLKKLKREKGSSQKTYIELAVEAELQMKKLQAQLIDESEQAFEFDLSVPKSQELASKNAQTRTMIAELKRQKKHFESLRGERIQDKDWFCIVPLSLLEKGVFLAIYEEQKSFRQVANELNCNVQVLKKIYAKAMQKIKQNLRRE